MVHRSVFARQGRGGGVLYGPKRIGGFIGNRPRSSERRRPGRCSPQAPRLATGWGHQRTVAATTFLSLRALRGDSENAQR